MRIYIHTKEIWKELQSSDLKLFHFLSVLIYTLLLILKIFSSFIEVQLTKVVCF